MRRQTYQGRARGGGPRAPRSAGATSSLMFGVAFLVALSGCSDTAIIMRNKHCPIEAKIIGADRDNLYVQGEFSNAPLAIPKAEIIEVDHPGNGMAITGVVISGLYSLQLLAGVGLYFSDDPFNRQLGLPYLISGLVGSLIGAGFTLWGYSIWSSSVEATERPPSYQLFGAAQPALPRPARSSARDEANTANVVGASIELHW